MSRCQGITKKTSAEPPQPNEVLCCEVHPSGNFFLSAQRDGQINLYDTNFKRMPRLNDGHTGAVTEAHFSNSGKVIYSCSKDSTIIEWDTAVGTRKNTFTGHINGVNCVQGAKEDIFKILCSGSKDGTVRFWDLRERACVVSLTAGGEVTATAFTENGEFIFSGGVDHEIKIWCLRTCSVVCSLQGHAGAIKGLSLSPCGAYLLSYSADNHFCIWDVRPYCIGEKFVRSISSIETTRSGLMRCSWSPDGKWVSAATSEKTTEVLNSVTEEPLCELSALEGRINAVAFHPNEPKVLTASSLGSHLWHNLPLQNCF